MCVWCDYSLYVTSVWCDLYGVTLVCGVTSVWCDLYVVTSMGVTCIGRTQLKLSFLGECSFIQPH